MLSVISRPSAGKRAPDNMDEPADSELLEKIALRQDREAFAALFSRYEGPAYSLAYALTRDHALAEDAVQAAMLNLWRFATRYEPERGNARGWILRIVANESNYLTRKGRREKRKMNDTERGEAEALSPAPSSTAEREELGAALKRSLEELPALEQKLVALYYGGGLSHDEIAAELSCPRSTVTFRIKKALDSMRLRLAHSGFSAAAPLVTVEGLNEAICAAYPAPTGLKARILNRLAEAGGEALKTASRRAAPVTTKASAWGTASLALALGAVAAGSVWWVDRGERAALAPERAEVAVGPEAPRSPEARPAELKPFFRRWSFEAGPPADIRAFQNEWSWQPGTNQQPPRMATVSGAYTGLLLPLRVPHTPLSIEIHGVRFALPGAGPGAGYNVLWTDGAKIPAHRRWCKPARTFNLNTLPSTQRVLMIQQYAVHSFGTEARIVYEFQKPYPADQLVLMIMNYSFEALEVRALKAEEIGIELQDPQALIARMGVPSEEQPEVALPLPQEKGVLKTP